MRIPIKNKQIRRLIKKDDPRINTAVSQYLKTVLEDSAKANGRTLGDEIRARLAVTFEQQDKISDDDLI